MADWPITFRDVLDARSRIRPYLAPTALLSYPPLDASVGAAIRVLVKHENHNPTSAFKARNAMAVMTTLTAEERPWPRAPVPSASRASSSCVTPSREKRWPSSSPAPTSTRLRCAGS